MNSLTSRIRYFKWNSAWLRTLLGLYYKEGNEYRIPFGPLRGKRLVYRSDITFHTMLGIWELEHIMLIKRVLSSPTFLHRSRVFCDVGANIGLFSLWFSRLAQGQSVVYAFEPTPDTIAILKKNVLLNNAKNISVIDKACSNHSGTVNFFIGIDHHSASLDYKWAKGDQESATTVIVDAITLDEFFLAESQRALPDFIKIDIEGGGGLCLQGCREIARQQRPLFFIESHTPDEDRAIGEFMLAHNYDGYRVTNHKWVQDKTKTYPDPDGVWGSILMCPYEIRSQIEKVCTKT